MLFWSSFKQCKPRTKNFTNPYEGRYKSYAPSYAQMCSNTYQCRQKFCSIWATHGSAWTTHGVCALELHFLTSANSTFSHRESNRIARTMNSTGHYRFEGVAPLKTRDNKDVHEFSSIVDNLLGLRGTEYRRILDYFSSPKLKQLAALMTILTNTTNSMEEVFRSWWITWSLSWEYHEKNQRVNKWASLTLTNDGKVYPTGLWPRRSDHVS